MGCEFSDRVRESKKELVKEVFNELTEIHKSKFTMLYGPVDEMKEPDTYGAYYHCKRVIRTYGKPPKEEI